MIFFPFQLYHLLLVAQPFFVASCLVSLAPHIASESAFSTVSLIRSHSDAVVEVPASPCHTMIGCPVVDRSRVRKCRVMHGTPVTPHTLRVFSPLTRRATHDSHSAVYPPNASKYSYSPY